LLIVVLVGFFDDSGVVMWNGVLSGVVDWARFGSSGVVMGSGGLDRAVELVKLEAEIGGGLGVGKGCAGVHGRSSGGCGS